MTCTNCRQLATPAPCQLCGGTLLDLEAHLAAMTDRLPRGCVVSVQVGYDQGERRWTLSVWDREGDVDLPTVDRVSPVEAVETLETAVSEWDEARPFVPDAEDDGWEIA